MLRDHVDLSSTAWACVIQQAKPMRVLNFVGAELEAWGEETTTGEGMWIVRPPPLRRAVVVARLRQ